MAPSAKPPLLRPGDSVRIVAPAGPFDRSSFDKGLEVLSRRYSPSFDEGLFARDRYLAGSDARRGEELRAAFLDPEVKAIFAVRGGYGAMRLLPDLDVLALPPKLLVGFSDITALHAALQVHGRSSIHGPVLTQLGRAPDEAATWLYTLLEKGTPPSPLAGGSPLVPGAAEGPLLGGNLSVLTRLIGTPFMPKTRGAILLLEDVTERPYRLDRMWTHLRLAGAFDGVAGIALGRFTSCDEPDGSIKAVEVLTELARAANVPCAMGFPVGHEDANYAVPLGTQVRLDAEAGTLTFLEALSGKGAA